MTARVAQARHLRSEVQLHVPRLPEHYGVIIDPCRAGKPKDKPQVACPILSQCRAKRRGSPAVRPLRLLRAGSLRRRSTSAESLGGRASPDRERSRGAPAARRPPPRRCLHSRAGSSQALHPGFQPRLRIHRHRRGRQPEVHPDRIVPDWRSFLLYRVRRQPSLDASINHVHGEIIPRNRNHSKTTSGPLLRTSTFTNCWPTGLPGVVRATTLVISNERVEVERLNGCTVHTNAFSKKSYGPKRTPLTFPD